MTQLTDDLSPPAPEVDEATRIWREMRAVGANFVGEYDRAEAFRSGGMDNCPVGPYEIDTLRTTLSELIASKDVEIERRIEELFDWEKIAKRTKEALTGAEDELRVCYSELATLRAESERLKNMVYAVNKAAERKAADDDLAAQMVREMYDAIPWIGGDVLTYEAIARRYMGYVKESVNK